MASVWVHGIPQGGKRRPPEKVAGHLEMKQARLKYETLLLDWKKAHGLIKRVDGLEALLFNAAGKLVGGAYIEPCSPPSAPEPGQPKRTAAA